MLSKSKYCKGLQCPKLLWLYVNKKEEEVYSESAQATFMRGTSVGELARLCYPNGVMAVDDFPNYQAAKYTQELIQQGVETIFEATFVFNDTIVAVDILHKNNGVWEIYEVKSSNSAHAKYFPDVAVQYFVVSNSGLNIGNAYLMHLNRDYVRHGEIDVHELFIAENITSEVLNLQEEIKTNIEVFHQLIAQPEEPHTEIGKHCNNPYHCAFYDYCHGDVEEEIEDVETDYSSEIDVQKVRDFVNAIEYPIAHFDFETLMYVGVPLWDHSSPYQQIPFQFSIHIQHSPDSEIIHKAYLAENNLEIDPRIDLIKTMIVELKNVKTVFVYNQTFEQCRIEEMMRDFPDYADELEQIIDKMVDLATPFRDHYYYLNALGNQWSLKKVIPLLYPELSFYENLDLGDGGMASETFQGLYYAQNSDSVAELRDFLSAYCKMDTWTMVKIWEKLNEV